ncbi:low-density lipoprotein receptor-related protein 11 [Tiliqua scincoides]|uniref:low-density lipoprotein receptor-related protein 11 n=1 Tax=Tiliqua scincoides TaxID=71010 RepID=UPI003462F853
MLQLPVDWVILDGRESSDDHGIIQYEWTLLQGAPSVDMKVPQPGTMKLSHLQEGTYTLKLTVTDTTGQRSSDNVSVTVLPMALGCVGVCSRYQFLCDDGCCIDITFACDREEQCRDGSDEAFCQKLNSEIKTVSHTAISSVQQNNVGLTEDANKDLSYENMKTVVRNQADKLNQSPFQGPKKQTVGFLPEQCLAPPAAGPCNGHFPRWHFDASSGTCLHFIYGGCQGNENNFLQESDCLAECVNVHDSRTSGKDAGGNNEDDIVALKGTHIGTHPVPETDSRTSGKDTHGNSEDDIDMLKGTQTGKSHPVPETGAVLPLALGLAITALLLFMVACRLHLVRQKMKKARPITSEESDYLINGMYL